MSVTLQFTADDGEIAIADLIARYAAAGLHAQRADDGFDHWIEFAETNTLVFLSSETDRVAAGQIVLSATTLAEDHERIIGPLRELGCTISDEDGDL